jgi:two-component system LytT family sensor kinase
MNSGWKKLIAIAALSFIPSIVIVTRNFIYFRKEWRTAGEIQYQVIFWVLSLVLSPLVVLYTSKLWTLLSSWTKVIIVQSTGFTLYLILHWSLSFAIYRLLIPTPGNRIWNLSQTILKDSFVLNLLLYLVTVFILYIWKYIEKNHEAEKRAANLERSLSISQLEVLKNQLNSHFLFNTLHNISSLIIRDRKNEANATLVNLSDLLRFSLKEGNEQFIPIYKEIELTRLYLEIQKTRFRERLHYVFDFKEENRDLLVPSFILQPLVENAIQYGIEAFSGPGSIRIQIELIHEMITLKVTDTGKLLFEKINFEGGIGIINTRERLKELYGTKFRLEFSQSSSDGKGVIVAISLPIQNKS